MKDKSKSLRERFKAPKYDDGYEAHDDGSSEDDEPKLSKKGKKNRFDAPM